MAETKILENEKPRTFTGVRFVKTKLQGGGECRWRPEDELVTKDKSINKNGVYVAEQEAYYGYKKLTVNVPNAGSISGYNPSTGYDTTYSVDPQTGEIVEKSLPSSITIVVNPTKTEYTDGETIDYSGLQVRALDGHGEVWQDADHPDGIIPMSELIFSESVAEVSKASGDSSASSELIPGGIPFGTPPILETFSGGRINHYEGGQYALVYNGGRTLISDHNETIEMWEQWSPDDETKRNPIQTGLIRYEYNGKSAYYGGWIPPSYGTLNVPVVQGSWTTDAVAWTILYGTITQGGTQTIPVQWMRPGDYKNLETSFDITVESSQATEHGGNSGGF